MPTGPRSPSSTDIPNQALIPFVMVTFLITWGLMGIYVLAPEMAADAFGEISGSHPFFLLATWAPAVASFLIIARHAGRSGIRAFLARLLIWRGSWGWAAFMLILMPLVFMAGSLIKGGPLLARLPPGGAGAAVAVIVVWWNRKTMFSRVGAVTVVIPETRASV
jgi:uncharacterized protein